MPFLCRVIEENVACKLMDLAKKNINFCKRDIQN